ncbi:hypothetical protein MtrunA17_Chr1g0170561 [Medicago truncatula]|uniref:Transmembrane protein n=1 Tax=Medicago truncatula TaxID=3880 RepID=A0A396JN98_MEDTR|nr:hypothetical protein MtrunA17_Chr1g0170561 [Medicago truncatula]
MSKKSTSTFPFRFGSSALSPAPVRFVSPLFRFGCSGSFLAVWVRICCFFLFGSVRCVMCGFELVL